MNKKERIINTIFMLWMTIFVGFSWVNYNNFDSAIRDLKFISILIYESDFNLSNGLIFGIIFNTITSQSEIIYLCLNFAWFGILIFMIIFSILSQPPKKKKKNDI